MMIGLGQQDQNGSDRVTCALRALGVAEGSGLLVRNPHFIFGQSGVRVAPIIVHPIVAYPPSMTLSMRVR